MNFPINTILYAKGWYQHRGDVDKMWLDLCHTINIDGWMVTSKTDVATWCLHRFDEFKKELWMNNDRFCLSQFFADMSQNQMYWRMSIDFKSKGELSQEDLIIWTFMTYLHNLNRKDVEGWKKPSEKVLPLKTYKASIETDYKTGESIKWTPAEMHCDVIERINKQFSDAQEQVIDKYCDFDSIEGSIRGKKVEDVLVLLGSDSLLDCVEVELTSTELSRANYHSVLINNEEVSLNLGKYDYCQFDDANYICRIKVEKDSWGSDKYTLISAKVKK